MDSRKQGPPRHERPVTRTFTLSGAPPWAVVGGCCEHPRPTHGLPFGGHPYHGTRCWACASLWISTSRGPLMHSDPQQCAIMMLETYLSAAAMNLRAMAAVPVAHPSLTPGFGRCAGSHRPF